MDIQIIISEIVEQDKSLGDKKTLLGLVLSHTLEDLKCIKDLYNDIPEETFKDDLSLKTLLYEANTRPIESWTNNFTVVVHDLLIWQDLYDPELGVYSRHEMDTLRNKVFLRYPAWYQGKFNAWTRHELKDRK